MYYLKILFLLFGLMACSHSSKNPEDAQASKIEVENIKKSELDSNIQIQSETPTSIAITDNENVLEQKPKVEKNPVKFNIYLKAKGYECFSLVGAFRALEENRVIIDSVSSEKNICSLITVLYAKQGKSTLLEWELFKLSSELSKEEYNSLSWQRVIKRFLDKSINLNSEFKIPYVDHRSGFQYTHFNEELKNLITKNIESSDENRETKHSRKTFQLFLIFNEQIKNSIDLDNQSYLLSLNNNERYYDKVNLWQKNIKVIKIQTAKLLIKYNIRK